MVSSRMEILKGLRRHFPKAYFIRWGGTTKYYLDKELSLEIEVNDILIEELYPYNVVNWIWTHIYENFSERCRV
jgi:hypothetical protein